jgi:NO-binding membrane sensor protein with MHYT domain
MAVCCQGEAEFTMRSVALSVLLGQAAVFCAAEDLAERRRSRHRLRQVKAAVSASYHGL